MQLPEQQREDSYVKQKYEADQERRMKSIKSDLEVQNIMK